MKYLAHTKDGKSYTNDDDCQLLSEHLNNTSHYAKERAKVFGAGEAAELMGLLHDAGKYSEGFQKYIRSKGPKSPHAMEGAYILDEKYDAMTKYYGLIIGSHHTGLLDWGTNKDSDSYCGKLHNHNPQTLPYKSEINLPDAVSHKRLNCQPDFAAFQIATYLRMLFSVLVDSDFTDTAEFCSGMKRGAEYPRMDELFNKLMSNMPKKTDGTVNQLRAEILSDCLSAAVKPQGLFSLTVPTGGGKTLSSLAFALKHAQTHGLRRVIYVIPYTSIIEQNAAVIREKLGESNVLEHHSNITLDGNNFKARWASENWDIPVIVTTNVQFFESLFAKQTTKSRKIHNISNSIVIFDEAQMLPSDYLSPCMAAVSELITNYSVTAVLCSATQPLVHKYAYKNIEISEIANNPDELAKKLKRVNFKFAGAKSDNEIIYELSRRHSALVVVNSRKHAFTLYKLAESAIEESALFYLSTLLTPKDRSTKIAEIKCRLAKNLPVIVISTQLIEAGVDVDFPAVYRSIAGIDSIIQAGGRANREGKLPKLGEVVVFEPSDSPVPMALQLTVSVGKEVISVCGDGAFGLDGIKKYFELLYHALERDGVMDKKEIMKEFECSRGQIVKMNFGTVAENFKLIDDNTHNIIIPCEESKELIEALRKGYYTRKTLRELQKYSINVYNHEYRRLCEDNAFDKIGEDINVLITPKYYSRDSGLDIFTEDNKNAESYYI